MKHETYYLLPLVGMCFLAGCNDPAAPISQNVNTVTSTNKQVLSTDPAQPKEKDHKTMSNPIVVMKTSMGDIEIELLQDKAPITVENFLNYVDEGFYDNTIFHRVIKNFMVQGGGFMADMHQKETHAPIKNEAKNGLKNVRGSLSMARTMVVDSATSQFFMNLVDNAFLDHGGRDYGYAVFAQIVEGMDVLDKIGAVPTGNKAGHQDVPLEPVTIVSVKRKAE
jgi:cyclophilin family peptidyl-prolyl cis-trans isomerase